MYFYEIHLHTAESSRCGRSSARDMIRDYHDRGFAGVAVTDHFVNGNSYSARWCLENASWRERMDVFLRGYREAEKAGKEFGIDVFFGWEYSYLGTGEDYLILGTEPEQLYTVFEDCDRMTIEEICDRVHLAGGIIIRAHPCRIAGYMTVYCIDRPGLDIDAVEAYNGGNAKPEYNENGVKYALKEHKPMTAGSDTHHIDKNASCCIAFDTRVKDSKDLCSRIKNGSARLCVHGEFVNTDGWQ